MRRRDRAGQMSYRQRGGRGRGGKGGGEALPFSETTSARPLLVDTDHMSL